MAKRPAVPARLRGSHPRRADGRFLSKAAARQQLARIARQRAEIARHEARSKAARQGWATRRAKHRAHVKATRKGHETRRIEREARAFIEQDIDAIATYHGAPYAIDEPIRELDALDELLDYFEGLDDFDDFVDYEAETNAGYESED